MDTRTNTTPTVGTAVRTTGINRSIASQPVLSSRLPVSSFQPVQRARPLVGRYPEYRGNVSGTGTTTTTKLTTSSSLKAPPPTSFNAESSSDKQRVLRVIQQEGKAKEIWKYLPLSWKHDKELILAALNNHTAELPGKSEFERTFPQSLRFDKDIVLAFCHRPDFTLKKKNKNKRNPKDTQVPDDVDDNASNESDEDRGLYYERHLFVPGCLTNDKQVMMAYCQKVPRSLQDCSEDLCNDRDVVTAAITNCSGLELQYASIALQQDIDMVKLACANHGRSLEFCPIMSPTHQALVQDRDFMLNVVLNHPGGGTMWKLLPPDMQQNDEELLLRALTNGLLLRDVPQQYLDRIDFLIKAIQHNCQLYLQLKSIKSTISSSSTRSSTTVTKWNHHPTLALEAIVSEKSTPEIHAAALGPDGCPTLQQSRPVVMAICQRGCIKMLQDILGVTNPTNNNNNNNNHHHHQNINQNEEEDLALAAVLHAAYEVDDDNNGIHDRMQDQANQQFQVLQQQLRVGQPLLGPVPPPPPRPPLPAASTSHFCNDMEVMKLAVQRDPVFFEVASPRLQSEPELILVSITPASAWNTLKTVPWSIQREHPQITVKAIDLCQSLHLRYLPTHIPEDMWTNHREVCMSWIRRGGRILEVFERMLRNDTEMALLVAKHNWSEFYKVGDRLLNDGDFLLQALQLDGRVFRFASPSLRQNFDVMIMAVANYYNKATLCQLPPISQAFAGTLDVDALKHEIQRLLDLHQLYMQQFLRGISIKTPHLAPALRSQLTLLDRGVETSEAFKRLIAEYLGVPFGPKLSLLRKADANINRQYQHHSSSNATTTTIPSLAWDDQLLFRNGGGGDGGAAGNARFAYRRFRWMARRRRPMMDQNDNNNNNNNNNVESDNDDDDDEQYFWIPRARRRRGAAAGNNNNNDNIGGNVDGGHYDNNRMAGDLFFGVDAPPNAEIDINHNSNNGGGGGGGGGDNQDDRLIHWQRRRERYYGRGMMGGGNDGARDAQHRDEMRRLMRADREAAMRSRHEIHREELQVVARRNAVDVTRARQLDHHERRLQEVMADVERTQRQIDERIHVARQRSEEGYARAVHAGNDDGGGGGGDIIHPPEIPLFGFDTSEERDETERMEQQEVTVRQERERRLELERQRRSDEMLARLEARNARYRAAERESVGLLYHLDNDDDDGPPPFVDHPPLDLLALEFDDLDDDDISEDMFLQPDM